MTIRRQADGWHLCFNEPEAVILSASLRAVQKHYAVEVEDLPEHLRAHWQGRLSRDDATNAKLEADNEMLAEERAAWRSQRLVAVQDWLDGYQLGRPWEIRLDDDRMGDFLAVLNDRRLTLSVEHGIGQKEMDMEIEDARDPKLRDILFEIEVLAMFQVNCLATLDGQDEDYFAEDNDDNETA